MKWYLAAPFLREAGDSWLDRFVPHGRHEFETILCSYQHDRSRKKTGLKYWSDYVAHGVRVRYAASRKIGHAGVITCFPQLPMVVGLQQRMSSRHFPVVAWSFNLGRLPDGPRRVLSKFAFGGVDRFIVHSRADRCMQ
jgi:hypothetical protein